jgi:hypothetical protein
VYPVLLFLIVGHNGSKQKVNNKTICLHWAMK